MLGGAKAVEPCWQSCAALLSILGGSHGNSPAHRLQSHMVLAAHAIMALATSTHRPRSAPTAPAPMPGSRHPPRSPPTAAVPSCHPGPHGPSARDPPACIPLQRATSQAPPKKHLPQSPAKALILPFLQHITQKTRKNVTGERTTAFTEERRGELSRTSGSVYG